MSETTQTARVDQWVISAHQGPDFVGRVREFWHYRSIIRFFAERAFKTLYSRTQLGWLWLLIRPLAPLAAGAIIYGGIMAVPSFGIPYFLFLLSSSIIWMLFDGPLGWGTRGLELNRHIIIKLYFPRSVLPMATMAPGLSDPMVLSGLLILSLVGYAWVDGTSYLAWHSGLLLLPVPIVLALMLAFGIALWTSVWQARARDTRFVLGYITGFWFFFTPVIYPLSIVPSEYHWLMWLNPLTSIVESFRWSLFRIGVLSPLSLLTTWLTAMSVIVSGFWYFNRVEAVTADKM
ncbi:MAG TPA: ABC transporter permease [Vicinamibacterales bacterium]|nr:ABC transporter permease [Vicinamibacterales bacterium]